MPQDSFVVRLSRAEIVMILHGLVWYETDAGHEGDGLFCLIKRLESYVKEDE